MKAKTKILCLLLCMQCLSGNTFAQWVGGSGNGRSPSADVKAAEVNAGGVSADVNLFTGTLNTSYPLGTVTTPSGLSFTASLSYNSTFASGDNLPHSTGIPYGEGWNLNLPMISISTEDFAKYSIAEKESIRKSGTPDPTEIYAERLVVDNQVVFNCSDSEEEGRLYYYSPELSIPGYASGRLVYKEKDATTDEYIFVLNVFDSYVEARLKNGIWKVITADGTIFKMTKRVLSNRNPSNQRVQDDCHSDRDVLANLFLPKTEILSWYCEVIKHPLKKGKIKFEYEDHGCFNFFAVYDKYRSQIDNFFNGPTWSGEHELVPTCRDIFIKKISSETNELEFNYQYTYIPGSVQVPEEGAPLYKPNGQEDELYSELPVISYNGNDFYQNNWKRYSHIKSRHLMLDCQGRFDFVNGLLNPYVGMRAGALNPEYVRQRVENVSGGIPFNHGYLESNRINANMPAGDIYQIKSTITHRGGSECLFDINLSTGDARFPENAGTLVEGSPHEVVPAGCYQPRNGESIYSTFNRAFKWPSLRDANSILNTSDFFVMPNHPKDFEGFHIQIGPSNSDNLFYLIPEDVDVPPAQDTPNPCLSYANDFLGYAEDPLAENPNTILTSGELIPQNFGIGMPWFAMKDFYADALALNPCVPPGSIFWWNNINTNISNIARSCTNSDTNCGQFKWNNQPTCASYCQGQGTEQGIFLDKVELIRYAKRPYMLTSVNYSELNAEGNLVLKQKISNSYEVRLVDRYASSILRQSSGNDFKTITFLKEEQKRNIFILTKINQEAVNGNAPALTTRFGYIEESSDQVPGVCEDQDFLFHNSKFIFLNKIIDPLGKETIFEYYPITDIVQALPGITNLPDTKSYSLASFFYRLRPEELALPPHSFSCTISEVLCNSPSPFPMKPGRPFAYQIYAVVKKKSVANEGGGNKIWTYDYPNEDGQNLVIKKDQIDFSFNFQYDTRSSRIAGYKKATVTGPRLDENSPGPEMKIVHYTDILRWGRVQKLVHRDINGQNLRSVISDYETLLTFDGASKIGMITDHPDFLLESRMYDVPRFYETRDWPNDFFNNHYLNSHFIKKTRETETISDNGGSMTTTTDYEYFDADEAGNSSSSGFTAMGISTPLTFLPSYRLYKKKTSFSTLPYACSEEEYFYLYDLINHPNHHSGNQPTGTILSELYNNWKVRGMPFEVRTTNTSAANDVTSHSQYTIYDTNWSGSLSGQLHPKKIMQKVEPNCGGILSFTSNNLNPVFTCEALELITINSRNENAQIVNQANEKGLVTETIYNSVGLPEITILGPGLNGEQRTTIVYNPDNTIQSLTDPNGTTLSYTYDGFLRLHETRRNGALIQDMTYSYWDGNLNPSLSFEERTDFNFVETNNYLSDTKSWYERAYVDPLGRPAAMIKEGVILENNIYDLWDRPVLQMKPQFGTAPVYGIPTGNATHLNQDFDVAPRSRPLASAKYGEALSGGHTVNSDYRIISHTDLITDLTAAGQTVLPEGYSFFKVKTTDEDGKEVTTYTNQLGQIAATVTNNGTTATVFRYDSHGNAFEVINPLNQINNYHYNFLGQMYSSTTVDDGTSLFGYNSSGELVAQEFANGQKRLYQYDSFNRPVHQVNTQSTGILLDNEGMAWVTNSDFETTLNNLINSPTAKFEKKYYYNDYFSGGNYPANALPYLQNSMSNTLGRVAQTSSYDLDGILVENCFYSYDEDGFLKWEMKQFKEPNSTDKGRLVRIDYRDYNRQGSFEKQQVDLNCDGSLDVQYTFKYDNWNRLKKAFINYDDPDNTNGYKVVSYDYDDVIGAVQKKVYFDSTEDPGGGNNTGQCDNVIVDEINYTYDQRFRLTDITSHLFDWKLYYDGNMDAQHTANFTANYNGNINTSRAVYKQENTNNILLDLMTGPTIYNYQYDNLNRLINADARVIQTGDTPNTTPCGDASYVYDKIGNLTQLTRCNDPFDIDYPNYVYIYNYVPGTNHLNTITDERGTVYNYTYDASGNMLTDTKRGLSMTASDYGRAHLPWKIQRQVGGNTQDTEYLYDTNDQRIFKSLTESGNSLNKEYYIRTSGGQELGVFDINNNALTWYFYGNERVAKIPHQATLSFTPGDAEGSPYTCTSSAPICNEESSGAQNLSLAVLRNNWITDPNALSLPENLYRIRICSGQELHILDSELGYLSGPYLTLQTIPINSLGDIFTYTTGNGVPETTTNLSGILLQRTIDEDVWINGYAACDPFNDGLVEITNPPIPNLTYYLYDHLGNTRVVYFTDLDCNGAITYFSKNMIDYFPYGKVFREKSSEQEKYLTTQHERDVETGLDYRGARFYDADIARFLSVDPLAADFASISSYVYTLNNPVKLVDPDGRAPSDPILGLSLRVSMSLGKGGVYFNAGATVSISHRFNFVQPSLDLSGNIYNGGLGTSSQVPSGFDLSAAAHVTVGGGEREGMPTYTLNYNTSSAFENTFGGSVTYGQMLTYNNATGEGTRQGLFGFRAGDFSFSSNNDTSLKPYFGGGTDQAWTGGMTASVLVGGNLIEAGFQAFTGTFLGKDKTYLEGGHKFYQQTSYMESLNRADTFIKFNGIYGGKFGAGWLQDLIHDKWSDSPRFKYNDYQLNIGYEQN